MPNDDDKMLLDWAIHYQKSVILVITKTDKVTKNEREANTRKILNEFNCENLHFVHYSVPNNQGRKELIHMIKAALTDELSSDEASEDEDKSI